MPNTNFPNGLNVGDSGSGTAAFSLGGTAVTATAAELNGAADGLNDYALGYNAEGKQLYAGTVIVPAAGSTAFKPSGIASAQFVVGVNPYGPVLAAGTGIPFFYDASVGSGGTVTIRSYDVYGNAGTVAGTASYGVIGT